MCLFLLCANKFPVFWIEVCMIKTCCFCFQSGVQLSSAQCQLREQLRLKHCQLQEAIMRQQQELDRISEQLLVISQMSVPQAPSLSQQSMGKKQYLQPRIIVHDCARLMYCGIGLMLNMVGFVIFAVWLRPVYCNTVTLWVRD